MKIAVIGASGTIGRAVVELLGNDHEIVTLGANSGDIRIDIRSRESVKTAFEQMGKVDAIINAVGELAFKPFGELNDEDWYVGIESKLLGQVRVTEEAVNYLNDGGSVTLTTGIISDTPIACGSSATAINGAVESYAKAAAIEAPRGIRINVVSPAMLEESKDTYGAFFPGFFAIPAKDVAQFYKRAVMGLETGKTLKCFAGNPV
ncbi:short chain dehydrogenase [Enterovibrio sp. ZSDZ35]|uniref:Short chain dehydrogenase n=1 Tax=Enterovibrio qingdaonensis TaxID=2899818 RepID=A0ABT5QG36_9GAMM|nr:short chain dehydrogenase [Enterovibrio sp. ZSDZ35]MDD1779934.1 short chain dehydrogenase [Enterovibrio sp. ZSDZ35]